MALRRYNAPNVEYNEIDRSQYGTRTAAVGTMAFATGFADKGDDYDIKYSETLEDFIASYGYPTNEAERYFFNTAYEAFKQGGRFASAKIPYSNESLDKFSFTAYRIDSECTPISAPPAPTADIDVFNAELQEALSSVDSTITSYIRIDSLSKEDLTLTSFGLADPSTGLMTMDQYDRLLVNGESVPENTLVIVDIARNKYSKDPNIIDSGLLSTNRYLGYVPVVVAPLNAIQYQRIIQMSKINAILSNGFQTIPNAMVLSVDGKISKGNQIPNVDVLLSNSFEVPFITDSFFGESVENRALKQFPSIKFDSSNRLDRKYLKQIGIVVFKMQVDVSNNKKIDFVPVEAFIGSLNKKDKDLITGKSIFIDEVVNQNSELINVFSHVNFSNTKWEDGKIEPSENEQNKASTYLIKDQTVTTLGFFDSQCIKIIDNEIVESSLDRILDKAKDPNAVPLDIVVDAGVSNIAQWIHSTGILFYEPEYDSENSMSIEQIDSTEEWKRIIQKFDNFAKNVRKDCIFLADGPRSLCLVGNEKVIRKSAPENTIERNMIPYIRKMIAVDSSYSAGYCNWFKCLDYVSRDYFWCPPSIKAMGVYLYTDRYANTWDAPAGDNRGRITDAVDIAFNPTVEQAQYFYMQQWNYAMAFPMTGIVLEGQRTFQTDQTALDRVNVRRLCNAIKKGVKEIARHYLYEQITDQVMVNFRDRISDFLSRIKNLYGISEYFIKLDRENNTPETIERNELHVTFAIRPIKSLEFIIINSVIANQSADLEEVVQSVLQ